VQDPRAALARIGDGRLERSRRLPHRARVRGVVEQAQRGALRGDRAEVGLPACAGIEPQGHRRRARQGDAGEVVGIPGVRNEHRVTARGGGDRGEHDPRLRPRDDGDLALGVELDAVVGRVAARDRLARRRPPVEGRVAVHRGRPDLQRGRAQRLQRPSRRRQVGVPSPEVDEARPGPRPGRGGGGEDAREVLLGQAPQHGRLVERHARGSMVVAWTSRPSTGPLPPARPARAA
jgi:hypothetical protein